MKPLNEDLFGMFDVHKILNIFKLNKYLIDIKYPDVQKISDDRLDIMNCYYVCRILPKYTLNNKDQYDLINSIKPTDKTNLYIWISIQGYFYSINNCVSENLLVEVPLHTYLTKITY